jgi:hypothetical protein
MLNLVRSSTKFGKYVLLASLCSLTACASNMPMPVEGMKEFRADCSKAEEQVAWLNSMRQSDGSMIASRLSGGLLGPAHSDFQANQDIGNHTINWWVDTNIRQVYRKCARRS